jgi:hypothetical protein
LNSGPLRFFVVNKSLVFKYSTVPACSFFYSSMLPCFHHTSTVHGFRRLNPPKRSPRECRLRDELSTSLSWTGLFTNLLRDCHILAVTVCRSENLRVLNSTKKRVNEYIRRILSQRVNKKPQKYQDNLQNYIKNKQELLE